MDTYVGSSDSRVVTAPLADFYYLDNFLKLIHSVYQRYDDLLSAEELGFYFGILNLGRPAQALYVRLLTRRSNFFRKSKIRYSEIIELGQAFAELESNGFIADDAIPPQELLFSLFTKVEWAKVFDEPQQKQWKKERIYDYFCALGSTQSVCEDVLRRLNDPIVELKKFNPFSTFKLLYFGNGNQDLTEFILRDLGIYQFEPYRLDKSTRLFNRRDQIEAMLHYYEFADSLQDLKEYTADDLVAFYRQLPPLKPLFKESDLAEHALNRRVQRLKTKLARQLERLGRLDDAFMIYSECSVPPSRERRARILCKQNQLQGALRICQDILLDGSASEQVFAQQFSKKLDKLLGNKVPERSGPQIKSDNLVLESNLNQSVEQCVAEHLSKDGVCFFTENNLFCGVFGLVFWPIIFAEINGAFTHPFQMAPHDLYLSDFIVPRQSMLDSCWQRLAEATARPKILMDFFESKVSIANPFVRWDQLTLELLELALIRIPLSHWRLICERLLSDLKENRSGLPDLIHFPEDGSYQLIEVKGPGDRLQANQIRWLEYLAKNNISCNVTYVQWAVND